MSLVIELKARSPVQLGACCFWESRSKIDDLDKDDEEGEPEPKSRKGEESGALLEGVRETGGSDKDLDHSSFFSLLRL